MMPKQKWVSIPWIEAGPLLTLTPGNPTQAASWLRLDRRAVQRIMDRAVERRMARRQLEEMPYLGMDEMSFRNGHRYGSLVIDLQVGRVLEVVEERATRAAVSALQTPPPEVLGSVKAGPLI